MFVERDQSRAAEKRKAMFNDTPTRLHTTNKAKLFGVYVRFAIMLDVVVGDGRVVGRVQVDQVMESVRKYENGILTFCPWSV